MLKKSKLTKVLSLVMALALVLSLVPITAMAREEQTIDLTDGTVVLAQEKDSLGDILSDVFGGGQNNGDGSAASSDAAGSADVTTGSTEGTEDVTAPADPTTPADPDEGDATDPATPADPAEGDAADPTTPADPGEEEKEEEQVVVEVPAQQPVQEQPASMELEKSTEMLLSDVYGYYNNSENYDPSKYEKPTSPDFYKIVHVDCGRKYFSPENLKKIIDNAAAAGFNQVELYLTDNQGFRFALDDMNVTTATGNTYNLTPALGDGYSDGSKYPDGSGKYLTQSEMSDIITYAGNKGIEIVPCINTPGHMGAILEEFKDFRYSGSKSSIDLESAEAVAFALAIVDKYATYFDSEGVKYFNLGADEYANDLSTMGFQGLYTSGKYQYFVNYLNAAARIIKSKNMTPRAFNDGIYYNEDNTYSVNSAIQVCYWSCGWSGYNLASAQYLVNEGMDVINTHGDYYWVLGNAGWQCSAEKAARFDYTSFQYRTGTTGNGTISDPAGAMFCIWCDVGNANGTDGGTAVVSATADVIAAFGAALPAEETPVASNVATGNIGNITVTVTALDGTELRSVVIEKIDAPKVDATDGKKVVAYDITPYDSEGNPYKGKATVTLTLPDGFSGEGLEVYTITDGSLAKLEDTDVSYDPDTNCITFNAPHFSEYDIVGDTNGVTVTENETITVTVGQTATDTIEGADYSNNIVETELDKSIATVSAKYEQVTGGTEEVKATSITSGSSYYIKNSSGQYLSSSATWVSDISSAALWTATSSDSGYKLKSGGNYLYYSGLSVTTSKRWATTWSFSSGMFSYKGVISSYTLGDAYTVTTTDAEKGTVVTFTGVAVGETEVTVGNVHYTIKVNPDLSGASNLTVEYWITNRPVTAGGATSKSISANDAYGEAGVELAALVPSEGTQGGNKMVFWKGTRLASGNRQTQTAGVDKTFDSARTDFTYIRYWDGRWAYSADGVTWTNVASGDQIIAYYLQYVAVTTEIDTLFKDWGFFPTDGGDSYNKVALTVAVVYPDGTVSPAESDMYGKSTMLYNYESGKKSIGLVVPQNNSAFTISKITVTDGKRDQTGTGMWGENDTITWEKITNEAGEEWYNETTYWPVEGNDGSPMVNGSTQNIYWEDFNTAKLVLIYLKPVHYDTNLIVKWVDDSASGALISTMEVAVSSDGTPITFYNGLKQTSALPMEGVGGTFTLDDNAYVTNSSNVNQTFNKNISTVPDVADVYKTGLYQYVSADLSADGMTLTLHYNINSSKLSKQYVVDFGLPVNVPLSDLIENSGSVTKVEITGGDATVNNDNSITYQPAAVLTGTATVGVKLTFNDNTTQTVRIGFVPATTVYY